MEPIADARRLVSAFRSSKELVPKAQTSPTSKISRETFRNLEDSAVEQVRFVSADGHTLAHFVQVDCGAAIAESARLFDRFIGEEGDAVLQWIIPRKVSIERQKDV